MNLNINRKRRAITMRLWIVLFIAAWLTGFTCLAEEVTKDEKARVNYSVGYQIGDDFKHQGVEINPEALVKGIQDALSGNTPLMSAKEQRAALVNLQRQVDAQQKQDDAKKVQE
jgi:FKBP-type peptidyl-prolyl cis-trans isomerase FklB